MPVVPWSIARIIAADATGRRRPPRPRFPAPELASSRRRAVRGTGRDREDDGPGLHPSESRSSVRAGSVRGRAPQGAACDGHDRRRCWKEATRGVPALPPTAVQSRPALFRHAVESQATAATPSGEAGDDVLIDRRGPRRRRAGTSTSSGRGTTGHTGGYTYADFAKVSGSAEGHSDGEIWTQTMWQLRQVLIAKHGVTDGTDMVRRIITNGMRSSRTTRASWTSAAGSCRRRWRARSRPTSPTSGRCSPSAAWATSHRRPAPRTSPRSPIRAYRRPAADRRARSPERSPTRRPGVRPPASSSPSPATTPASGRSSRARRARAAPTRSLPFRAERTRCCAHAAPATRARPRASPSRHPR